MTEADGDSKGAGRFAESPQHTMPRDSRGESERVWGGGRETQLQCTFSLK